MVNVGDVVDEDGLGVHLLLSRRPLVRVRQQRVQRPGPRRARAEGPRRQLPLLEVLVLCVRVRHVGVLLPALAAAAVACNTGAV